MLEHAVRDVLNRTAPAPVRRPRSAQGGHRELPRGAGRGDGGRQQPGGPVGRDAARCPSRRELWIERDDFMEEPPPKFFRLAPGREVRLRSAYFVTCREVVKDAAGEVVELRCTYDPATRGGDAPDGRRPKATLHWVSADARDAGRGAPVRPPLQPPGSRGRRPRPLRGPQPGRPRRSSRAASSSRRSPRRRSARPSSSSGSATSRRTPTRRPGHLVFNRTLTLKDTWAKVQAQGRQGTA